MKMLLTLAVFASLATCVADELYVAKSDAPVYIGDKVRASLKRLDVVRGTPNPTHRDWVNYYVSSVRHDVEAKFVVSERDIITAWQLLEQIQRCSAERRQLQLAQAMVLQGSSAEGRVKGNTSTGGTITTPQPGGSVVSTYQGGGTVVGTFFVKPGPEAAALLQRLNYQMQELDQKIASFQAQIAALRIHPDEVAQFYQVIEAYKSKSQRR